MWACDSNQIKRGYWFYIGDSRGVEGNEPTVGYCGEEVGGEKWRYFTAHLAKSSK